MTARLCTLSDHGVPCTSSLSVPGQCGIHGGQFLDRVKVKPEALAARQGMPPPVDLFPSQWDGAAKAAAREAGVRYACETAALCVATLSIGATVFEAAKQHMAGRAAITDDMEARLTVAGDVVDLAAVTGVCAFICWASTLSDTTKPG